MTVFDRDLAPRASRRAAKSRAAALPQGLRWLPLAVLAGGLAVLAGISTAKAEGIAGSWSGGGSVMFPSGAKEKARCKAHFAHMGSRTVEMSASCATASGKVGQSATLQKVGANSYKGRFVNPEYGVTGSIRVTVNGNHMSAWLSGSNGASASLGLKR